MKKIILITTLLISITATAGERFERKKSLCKSFVAQAAQSYGSSSKVQVFSRDDEHWRLKTELYYSAREQGPATIKKEWIALAELGCMAQIRVWND